MVSRILFPHITRDVIIGIDHYSFEVKANQPFNGIIDIPSRAIHVIHFQHINENSVRYGYWFNQGDYYFLYNESTENFEIFKENNVDKFDTSLKQFMRRKTIAEFPKVDEGDKWTNLSERMTWKQISKVTGINKDTESFVYIDSSMTTKEENELLEKVLNGQAHAESEKEFNYTPIKFKSRDALRHNHAMEDFNDKSYYLNCVILPRYFDNLTDDYFGELQFAFLNSILFCNYGSSLQWHSLIELIYLSSKVDSDFLKKMDRIVAYQIDTIPEEYMDTLVNITMWRRCIADSFQANSLPLIKQKILQRIPELLFSNQEPILKKSYNPNNNDTDSIMELDTSLPNIDNDYDDDDDGPVIVESITYR